LSFYPARRRRRMVNSRRSTAWPRRVVAGSTERVERSFGSGPANARRPNRVSLLAEVIAQDRTQFGVFDKERILIDIGHGLGQKLVGTFGVCLIGFNPE
jgi:hypothetical protein